VKTVSGSGDFTKGWGKLAVGGRMLLIVFWQSLIIWLEVNEQPGMVHGTTTELLFIK
jgi:hypothetical protein